MFLAKDVRPYKNKLHFVDKKSLKNRGGRNVLEIGYDSMKLMCSMQLM